MDSEWRTDHLRGTEQLVRWLPIIRVTQLGRWAGRADDDRWVVGEPGSHILLTDSPPGVIALLPLLETSMQQIASDLGVASLAEHELHFEHVLQHALAGGSGYWAELAVAWLEAGFPADGCRTALQQAVSDKRVPQRIRQIAGHLLQRLSPESRD